MNCLDYMAAGEIMKQEIHPQYRLVAFEDMSTGDIELLYSAVYSKHTIEIDGVSYPHYKMETSWKSHAFYTGKKNMVDTTGRIDKYQQRHGRFVRK